MNSEYICKWEQDGEGDGGTMLFVFAIKDVKIWFPDFKAAIATRTDILDEMRAIRYDARRGLIQEIASIQP